MDSNSLAILILLGSFFVMVFLRFPIAYAVGLSSVFCMTFLGMNLNDDLCSGRNKFRIDYDPG